MLSIVAADGPLGSTSSSRVGQMAERGLFRFGRMRGRRSGAKRCKARERKEKRDLGLDL